MSQGRTGGQLSKKDPGLAVRGRHGLSMEAATLEGWDDLQILDCLIMGSDASEHRPPSLGPIPVPHTRSSSLVSGHGTPGVMAPLCQLSLPVLMTFTLSPMEGSLPLPMHYFLVFIIA